MSRSGLRGGVRCWSLAAGSLAASLALSGCRGGLVEEDKPAAATTKLCEAASALADAVALARASVAAGEAGDGLAAAEFAQRADTRRQDGLALQGWAGDLEARTNPPTPGYGDRMREIAEAQQAVDLVSGVLAEPAARVAIEARPRLLAEAEDAVHAIRLPGECTAVVPPSTTP